MAAAVAACVAMGTLAVTAVAETYTTPAVLDGVLSPVPAGAHGALIDMYGAQGNGKGAHVIAGIAVTPGESLKVFVGGMATGPLGGANGGGAGGATGGGGASDVRRAPYGLDNRIVVAGGGGGAGAPGLGTAGAGGASDTAGSAGSGGAAGGGGGGRGLDGGPAGTAGTATIVPLPPAAGMAGAPGLGGGSPTGLGGGGGGGYFGGGSGGGGATGVDGNIPPNPVTGGNGGGGGGSSFVLGGNGSVAQDSRAGDGQVTITYTATVPLIAAATPGSFGQSSTLDRTKPRLSGISFSATTFRAAKSGASISRKKKKFRTGTKAAFNLSEFSAVKFTVERKTKGRKVGKKCKAQTKSNKKKKACTRWVKAKGSFTVFGKAGKTRFTYRGRIGGKALKPGSYRLTGTATDPSKNVGLPRRKAFKIVK
jgi:hypothetical protein